MVEIGFGEKIKSFLVSPVETFQKVKDEDLGMVLKYFIVLAVIFSILYAIIETALATTVSWLMPLKMPFVKGLTGELSVVALFVISLFLLVIGLFLGAAIIHVFIYLLGGKRGFVQTVKAIGYGMTPTLILGWIPVVGRIVGIWSLVVEILGIRELQDMSTGKAALAVILPLVIYVIIGAISIFLYTPTILYAYNSVNKPTSLFYF